MDHVYFTYDKQNILNNKTLCVPCASGKQKVLNNVDYVLPVNKKSQRMDYVLTLNNKY